MKKEETISEYQETPKEKVAKPKNHVSYSPDLGKCIYAPNSQEAKKIIRNKSKKCQI